KLPDAISVFILPPDRKTLEERLRKRGEDGQEVIQRRLEAARREIQNCDRYNYILINDRLPESIETLQAIVLSERLQRSGRPLSQEEAEVVRRADGCRLANIRDRLQPILESFQHPVTS
ncbi:MAG: guanylate kinase, partial [Candidatus Sulfotelmatobacter sp.]